MGRGQLIVSAKGVRLENKDKLKFKLVAQEFPDWRVNVAMMTEPIFRKV